MRCKDAPQFYDSYHLVCPELRKSIKVGTRREAEEGTSYGKGGLSGSGKRF